MTDLEILDIELRDRFNAKLSMIGKDEWSYIGHIDDPLLEQLDPIQVETIYQEYLKNKVLTSYTGLVDSTVQSVIDTYNVNHSVAFSDINSLYKYTSDPNYSHYQFAVYMMAWNIQVWESFRATMLDVQSGAITLPTEAELVASLPAYGGVV